MKSLFSKFILIFTIVLIVGGTCLGVANGEIKFTLESFKMKVGTTQSLGAVISGKGVDYSLVESSNETVLKVQDNGSLKAVSTGISTLSYPSVDKDGKDTTLYCYVEVTRDTSTFNYVNGTQTEKINIYLSLDGTITTIESGKAAIPTFPAISKTGYVLDGWYEDAEFTKKITDRQRFSKDTTLYARWITEEEANKFKPVAVPMYEDVVTHWARNAIESVSNLGLFNGISEGKFGPDNHMTRAMTVAVLGRLDGAVVEGKASNVSDAKAGSYYDGYLAWAIENGIVKDVVDNKFRPSDEITREETAIYVANYINYKGYKNNSVIQIYPSFSDASSLSKEGKEAVDLLYCLNIMQGNPDNTFAPKSSLTRAQIAQIFFNYYNFSMKYKG